MITVDAGAMMEDNSSERQHDAFFYGLYMDPLVLQGKGVVPRNPRRAKVHGFELRIGNKATLVRKSGAEASGMVYSLTHREMETLYRGSGLVEYAPEALLAEIRNADRLPVLCYNLLTPPGAGESNPDYQNKLLLVKKRLGLEE